MANPQLGTEVQYDPTVNPYPGLRPFLEEHQFWFFGREGQSEEILKRLRTSRFVAVIGPSGSGKSSLVKAGLLPMLHSGLLARAGTTWRPVVFRPEQDPILKLAGAISEEFRGIHGPDTALNTELIRATLRHSSLGLVQAIRDARLSYGENVLIVVDQFEELFRFKDAVDRRMRQSTSEPVQRQMEDRRQGERRSAVGSHARFLNIDQRSGKDRRKGVDRRGAIIRPFYEDDAAKFVNLLLRATSQREVPIYVVITMRSDFIGDCTRFRDLPEAINKSEYLIPRLTRDQQKLAITGPAAVQDVEMQPALVDELLNDIGEDPDQLPVLQHALMRMWDLGDPQKRDPAQLHDGDYPHQEGLSRFLPDHADEAFDELNDEQKDLAKRFFKFITTIDDNGRKVRAPAELGEICEVVQHDGDDHKTIVDDVRVIVNTFRKPGRFFLQPPFPKDKTWRPDYSNDLRLDTVIDISHESLIRKWDRLIEWVDEEAEDATIYKRLRTDAALWNSDDDLYTGTKLKAAEEWEERFQPTAAWARRYGGDVDRATEFSHAIEFLRVSVVKRTEKEEEERRRIAEEEARKEAERARKRRGLLRLVWGSVFLAVAGVLVAGGFLALWQRAQAANHAVSASDLREASALIAEGKVHDGLAYLSRAVTLNPRNIGASVLLTNTLMYRNWPVPVAELPHGVAVSDAVFSVDGQSVLTTANGAVYLWQWQNPPSTAVLLTGAAALSATFSPDGQKIAVTTDEGLVRTFSANGDSLFVFDHSRNSARREVQIAAWSLDGRLLASGARDGTVRVWRDDQGAIVDERRFGGDVGWVTRLQFSPVNPSLLLVGTFDGRVSSWDVSTGATTELVSPDESEAPRPIETASFDAVGTRVIAAWDSLVRVMTLNASASRIWHHDSTVTFADFGPDGTVVLTVAAGRARVYQVGSGSADSVQFVALPDTTSGILFGRFSPSGQKLATVSRDSTTRIWDADSLTPITEPLKQGGSIFDVRFHPSENLIVTASADGTARVWNIETRAATAQRIEHELGMVRSVAFNHPLNDRFITASQVGRGEGKVSILDLPSGTVDSLLIAIPSRPSSCQGTGPTAAISQDGRSLVVAGDSLVFRSRLERGGGEWIPLRGHSEPVRAVQFSDDGQRVVAGADDGKVIIWGETGIVLKEWVTGRGRINSVSFGPDQNLVLTAHDGGTVMLWDAEVGTETVSLPHGASAVCGSSFEASGGRVLTFSVDGAAKVWDAVTGVQIGKTMTHAGRVFFGSFDNTGQRVVTVSEPSGGQSAVAMVWNASNPVETGLPLSSPMEFHGRAFSAQFSDNGELVFGVSDRGAARMWDVGTSKEVSVFQEPLAGRGFGQFTADGRRLVIAARDGFRLYNTPTVEPDVLRRLAEVIGGYQLSPGGAIVPVADRQSKLEKLRSEFRGQCADSVDPKPFPCQFDVRGESQ